MDENSEFKKKYNKAMNTAIGLLSRRNHTKFEIMQKLKQREIEPEIISKVISECERYNYINDEETGRILFRQLRAKGYGLHRIRYSMKKKGLGSELTDSLLAEYDSETGELENARKVLLNKLSTFNREKDLRKRKGKIYRFLYSRGFAGSVISELINQYVISDS
ncbi:MAG: regulatory protein RecX [Desulfobacterales bacterium]|nr:regulatory protein RecX [Desulfobacterales bacterium]